MTNHQNETLTLFVLIVGIYAAEAAGSRAGQYGFILAFVAVAASQIYARWVGRKERDNEIH